MICSRCKLETPIDQITSGMCGPCVGAEMRNAGITPELVDQLTREALDWKPSDDVASMHIEADGCSYWLPSLSDSEWVTKDYTQEDMAKAREAGRGMNEKSVQVFPPTV